MLHLLACAWIGDDDLARLADRDGDEVSAWEDCDDEDRTVGGRGSVFDDEDGDGVGGAPRVGCPGDGVEVGGDCDDDDASVGAAQPWYVDADGDGFAGTDASEESCEPTDPGASEIPGLDCDDALPEVAPDAVEDCNNTIDDDCDGATDECNLRDAGVLLHYAEDSGGLGGFPSAFAPTSEAHDDLILGRPWAQSVELYAGTSFPASGEYVLGDYDYVVRDGPASVGNALAIGDLDADGVWDLVVGAASDTEDEPPYYPEPKAVWLRGSLAGDSAVDDIFLAESGTSQLGQTVAVGDFDDDGVGDLVLGAPGGESGCGALYVEFGSASFPAWEQVNSWYNDEGSRGLKVYGHCDGVDAEPDGGLGTGLVPVPSLLNEVRPTLLAVGDPHASGRGAVYVWRYGTVPTDPARTLDLSASEDVQTWTGVYDGALAGVSVATGDLDGDGVADLATGAPYAESSLGRVYVLDAIAQQDGGSLDDADAEVRGEASENGVTTAAFGITLAIVADADDDGYDELAIGAPNWSGDTRGLEAGAVYLLRGPLDGTIDAADADARLYGGGEDWDAGVTLDGGGDLDGDGLGDLLVGVPGWSAGGGERWGAIVLVYGGTW